MYKNKEWLHQEYIEKQRSTTDIARDAGVSHNTICRWAKKHGIKLRNAQEGFDLKFKKDTRTKMQKAMQYYIKSQSTTTKTPEPSLNWGKEER